MQKNNNDVIGERKAQGNKCHKKSYSFRVDKQKFTVDQETTTGLEILELAQKTPPERYQLNQKFRGGAVETVSLNDVVDLTCPGLEKFMTIPLDQRGG